MWGGSRRPDFEGNGNAWGLLRNQAERVDISEAGRAAQADDASAIKDGLDAADNDPILTLIRLLLAELTGRNIDVFDADDMASTHPAAKSAPPQLPPQRADFGVEYDYHESYTEVERTSFDATGVVKTEDGREISFSLSLEMARSFHVESDVSLRLGEARQKSDPLVINFSGDSVQLTNRRFAFDLNADGAPSEKINFATGGSGFLAFDRNSDGVINGGAELFGAKTGDGFAELAALDADGNGWIDENDAVYAQLSVWSKNESGVDVLRSLKDANVGAISLARIATPFEIKDEDNALRGAVRTSGVYLKESGGGGSVQQVDLTV